MARTLDSPLVRDSGLMGRETKQGKGKGWRGRAGRPRLGVSSGQALTAACCPLFSSQGSQTEGVDCLGNFLELEKSGWWVKVVFGQI